MEKEPIKLPEQEPMMAKPKNKFKPLAIVFIVLTVLFALAAGFFVWQWLDQKGEINDLNNKMGNSQESNKEEIITSPFSVTKQEIMNILKNVPIESEGHLGFNVHSINSFSTGYRDSQLLIVYVIEKTQEFPDGVPPEQGLGDPVQITHIYLYRNNQNYTWKFGFWSGKNTYSHLPDCSIFSENIDFAKAAMGEQCSFAEDNTVIDVYGYLIAHGPNSPSLPF